MSSDRQSTPTGVAGEIMRSPMLRPKKRPPPPPRPHRSQMGWVGHGVGALLVSAMFISTVGFGFLYLRLTEGPVSLGPLAEIIVRQLNDGHEDQQFQVGDVVLALGQGGGSSGLRLRDVAVLDAEGATIARAPEVGVQFRAWDAVQGDLAPTRIGVVGSEATLRRGKDGAFSFNFAETAGASGGSFFELLQSAERDEGALRKLSRIEASDVTLTYDDRATDQSWTADGVSIAVWRLGDALYGSLTVRADLGDGNVMNLALAGDRPLLSAETSVTASFSGAEGRDIGGQIPELGWLNGIHAPISGTLALKLGDDGGLRDLYGRLEVGAGALIAGDGAQTAIKSGALTLGYDPATDRFAIRDARVDTEALSVTADGMAEIVRADNGGIGGLIVQTSISDAGFAPPGVFVEPLEFDAGKVTARVSLNPLRIELGEAHLSKNETRFDASGEFWRSEGAWRTDVKFAARDLAATDLVRYWPEKVGPRARLWTAANIRGGLIETVTGFARIGDGKPQFALNFTHRDVEAHVVVGMSPITRAAGTGQLDADSFVITVDDGDVVLGEDREIALNGSSFRIADILAKPAQAAATLKARGRIVDILELIDQPPLKLTSKFEADLTRIRGDADVVAELSFPMLRKITPAVIEIAASAALTGVRYPTPFGGLVAMSPNLALNATPRRLDVEGPVSIGGFNGHLNWREQFLRAGAEPAPGPRTLMTLATRLDAATVKRLDLNTITISAGHAPLTLTLSADKGAPLALAVKADLGPARLSAPGLGLVKGEGAGTVTARGVLRDGLAITALKAAGPGFAVEGAARLDPALRLRSADLTRFEVGGHTALSVGLEVDAEGAKKLDVRGAKLDLQWLTSLNSGGQSTPTEAKVAVDRLRLTQDLVLRGATGLATTSGDATEANISGKVNGGAVASVGYQGGAAGGEVRIEAADAGGFLRDLGYFDNGYGGVLALQATLGPGGVAHTDGDLAIDGLVVRNAPALANMLSIASLIGLFDALQSGGITFSKVRAPFKVRGGQITLDEATAVGPTMGLKMDGTYETGPDRIDMTGVLTPAYALNAVLSKVPLIGDVLGGAGEGVFAFTFTAKGQLGAPEVSVNPLSVLTPGVLRNVFAGKGTGDGAKPQRRIDYLDESHDK